MAYSFGRQFRRNAAQALTTDPDEMRVLIARILPPREDGAPRVLRLESEADCERAPAVIVAAFFDDALTGDEAAHLLAHAMNPATRKRVQEERRAKAGDPLAESIRAWREGSEQFRLEHPEVIARWEREAAERCNAANKAGGFVNNNGNTSAPADGGAAEGFREHPPPINDLQIVADSHGGGHGAQVG